jgi:phosphopantothenoylcysteine decarboxylase/phosphopantothenate--cysteine ligase
MLFRKKIILAVTGSIAAYKSALLARLLVKAGAEVRVVMTDSSKDFITPLTLSTLTKNEVVSSFTSGPNGAWTNHVELGIWGDVMLMAPASANMIAQCANGSCHNLMAAVYLSARCPVFFAPAMDLDMWRHPATQHNVDLLRSRGNYIIEPASGELASGLVGEGRMAEPDEIVHRLETFFNLARQMHGKKVLITAGPTREAIDPVRFISNHSSGKMGFALAEELAARGASVVLITGPVSLSLQHPTIARIDVTTAAEMLLEAQKAFPECDAAILTAAVADFKPAEIAESKIKKDQAPGSISLTGTTDILKELASNRQPNQHIGGFALETDNGKANAELKLQNKNLDFIVLNELSEQNSVFGSDFNSIAIFSKESGWQEFGKQSKAEAARSIAGFLDKIFHNEKDY